MKVGIFIAESNGGYPVPAVKGGAIAILVEHLVKENNKQKLIEIEIISFHTPEAEKKSQEYPNVKFVWIKVPKIITWMDSKFFFLFRKLFRKRKVISYKSLFSLIYYIYNSIKIIGKGNYDKVVLENTVLLAWIIKLSNYKGDYYYHLHNIPRINGGCKEVFQNASSILCVSNYVAEQIRSDKNPIGPILPDKIKILYNCVDTEHFQRVRDKKEILKCQKTYGIAPNDKVIIFVGRLSVEKGIDKLLDAAKKVNETNIKLLIIGSLIYNENIIDDYQISLYKSAKELKDKVVFTGYISQNNLPLYYSIADIAVLPSMWDEPAGLTMIEAISCGVPIITTNCGGIPEYVGGHGVIIERENIIQELTSSLNSFFRYGKSQDETSADTDYIRHHFSCEKYFANFLKCLSIDL